MSWEFRERQRRRISIDQLLHWSRYLWFREGRIKLYSKSAQPESWSQKGRKKEKIQKNAKPKKSTITQLSNHDSERSWSVIEWCRIRFLYWDLFALRGLPSCWLTITTYYIHDNHFTITPNILMLQCYISTAVWLALLFLYFHKLNCGEVEPLRIFLVICFVWWWSIICISRSSVICTCKRRLRISIRQVWQLVLIFVERW